ncbi:MAG: TrkA family potassium uptake protein [Planctomycetaceae bacterium]|nr:TrkA family potassium uptake protein [Planctomycetaceae bacterium]
MQKIAVIGLGRFGMALARKLGESRVQVIAIDRVQQLVNEIKNDVDIAVQLDSTDRQALLSQDVDKVDVCVVSIGENFEASLLTTVLVKQLGVKHIVCRAQTALHAEIFRQIGAHQVVQPEQEAGNHIARRLANPKLADVIPLSSEFSLVELHAPKAFHGQSVRDIGLREKYNVNLVVVKRISDIQPTENPTKTDPTIIEVPGPDRVIAPDDILVLVGANEALAHLPKA